jgi:hypothetical protein
VSDVEELYHQFLQINHTKPEDQPSIFDYIDKNRGSLSKYLAKTSSSQPGVDFTLQAKFINTFRENSSIYPILRKIYLGSIISGYLEFETEGKQIEAGVEFVLDTNFVVGLLDLSNVESTHTCKKILDICKTLGYRISVLDYTVEETRELLQRTAEQFDGIFLARRINPESIYNACERRHLTQTELQRLSSSLEDIFSNQLGIFIVRDTRKLRNEAKFSAEYEKFKAIRINEWSALHDATAVKYVQYKRGKRVKDFQDAKCWFVTNPHRESKFLTNDEFLPEIISAEDLVNILWLTNPNVKANVNVNDLSEIGLSRLVSSTLSASLPSARIIKELDQNIQKYAKDVIPDAEIIRVAKRIASKTNASLDELNKTASLDPVEFVRRLQEEARRAEEEQTKFEESLKRIILKIKQQVEERASEREKSLIETYKGKESDLRAGFENTLANSLAQREIESKKAMISKLETAVRPLGLVKEAYDISAGKRAHFFLALLILLPLCIVTFLYFIYDWNFFDSKSIVPTVLLYLLPYSYFVLKNKEWSLKEIWNDLKENETKRYYTKYNFDVGGYIQLQAEIERLKSELRQKYPVSEAKKLPNT